jgi:hypothetical protein
VLKFDNVGLHNDMLGRNELDVLVLFVHPVVMF